MFKWLNEKKARRFINLMTALDGKPGVDLSINLDEDILRATVSRYSKRLLKTKINLEGLCERTLDEISYCTFKWI